MFRSSATKERLDASENLTLEAIRNSLIRQEDSIIFSLLERSQYCYNADTYDPSAFSMDGFDGSLVEYMVRETEKLHAKVCWTSEERMLEWKKELLLLYHKRFFPNQVGRYKSPDEHPFFPNDLPDPMLPPLKYPQVYSKCIINMNTNFLWKYDYCNLSGWDCVGKSAIVISWNWGDLVSA